MNIADGNDNNAIDSPLAVLAAAAVALDVDTTTNNTKHETYTKNNEDEDEGMMNHPTTTDNELQSSSQHSSDDKEGGGASGLPSPNPDIAKDTGVESSSPRNDNFTKMSEEDALNPDNNSEQIQNGGDTDIRAGVNDGVDSKDTAASSAMEREVPAASVQRNYFEKTKNGIMNETIANDNDEGQPPIPDLNADKDQTGKNGGGTDDAEEVTIASNTTEGNTINSPNNQFAGKKGAEQPIANDNIDKQQDIEKEEEEEEDNDDQKDIEIEENDPDELDGVVEGEDQDDNDHKSSTEATENNAESGADDKPINEDEETEKEKTSNNNELDDGDGGDSSDKGDQDDDMAIDDHPKSTNKEKTNESEEGALSPLVGEIGYEFRKKFIVDGTEEEWYTGKVEEILPMEGKSY